MFNISYEDQRPSFTRFFLQSKALFLSHEQTQFQESTMMAQIRSFYTKTRFIIIILMNKYFSGLLSHMCHGTFYHQ